MWTAARIEGLVGIIVFAVVAAIAMWRILAPDAAVARAKKSGRAGRWMSGHIFYASPTMTRITSFILLLVAIFAMFAIGASI